MTAGGGGDGGSREGECRPPARAQWAAPAKISGPFPREERECRVGVANFLTASKSSRAAVADAVDAAATCTDEDDENGDDPDPIRATLARICRAEPVVPASLYRSRV